MVLFDLIGVAWATIDQQYLIVGLIGVAGVNSTFDGSFLVSRLRAKPVQDHSPCSDPPPLKVKVPFDTTISLGLRLTGRKRRASPRVLSSVLAAASKTD